MAQSDANLIFTGGSTGSAQAITSSAVGSTGILDLATGSVSTGSTYSASPVYTGQHGLIGSTGNSLFGEDLGIGAMRLMLLCTIGTAFTTGGTSLNIALQGAVDASSGSYPANFSSLTWSTYAETGAIAAATLIAAGANAQIPLFDWPHRLLAASMPRFIRMLYTPVGTLASGTISFCGIVLQRQDNPVGLYPSGFSVA